MPEPKDMTDEELDAAIANTSPEPDKVDPPAQDEPEPETPEEPEEVEKQEEEEETPEPLVSRREQLRIQQVLEKLKQQPQAPSAPKATGLNYADALDADPELIKQLEADRQSAVSSALAENNTVMQTYRWETMVNLDSPQVESKYPQLDKNSPEFNPALSSAIGQMYFNISGLKTKPDGTYTVENPGIRYRDYVDDIFELGNEIAGEKTVATTKNVAKQAAQTALRPDGSRTKKLNLNQAPENMTDEELDAVIAQAIPNR